MRIVVYRPGALGDALLTFPALAALRKRWPDARVTLICRADVHALAFASGLAEGVYSHELAAWMCLFDDGLAPSGLAREALSGADLALAWAPDAEGALSPRLRALGAREVVVAAPPPQTGYRRHVARQALGALTPLGVSVPADLATLSELLPPLKWPQKAREEAETAWGRIHDEASDRPPMAVHPGSGGASKRWPASHFAALIRALRADVAPVLIAGPQDEAIVMQIVAEVGAMATVRDLSVAGLAAFLSRCGLYIGNDSGVTHLAGMLGLPTIALFGPTDPALWSPLGPRVVALRSPTGRIKDVPPEAVVAAIRERT
jgi:ADP-heptose:LPS heptosyltransferase